MKTIEPLLLPGNFTADDEAILESLATGKPVATEIRDRVRAEARRLSEELRMTHGVQEVSAQLIRECRDEV